MTYPTRGRWRFRNVTRDFYFGPRLTSIGIEQEHPELQATLSCDVVDRGEGYQFEVGDEVRVTFAGERILAGHIERRTHGALADESDTRLWSLQVADYTGKLSDAIVRRRRKRRREGARRRIRWLLRYMTRRVWPLDGIDLSHVPAGAMVEPYDYFGNTVDEGLSHVADELNGYFYIDLDNVFRWYQGTDAVAAPFGLSNDGADFVTTFPFREWSDTDDAVDLANAVLMSPEKRRHSRWVKDATSITAYGRRERFVSDENIHRKAAARRVASKALAEGKDPSTEATLVVHEPGLWAGMKVHVTESLWGVDADRYVTSVSISALDPHDDEDKAYLKTAMTLKDRRHRRGHVNRAVNKNTRRRPGQHANVTDYVLDDFTRTVAPPTWEPGDAMGSLATYEASKGQTVTWDDIPFDIHAAALPVAASYIGAGYLGHTTEDCGCPGLDNCFKGWKDIERWYWLTVPAHPADMAGATVTVSAPGLDGVAATYGARVVVLSQQPTDTWQGSVVGLVGAGGGEVFIPGGLIPAAGGELHIGLQAGWHCDYGDVTCGWVWPFTTGAANSGRYRASIASPTWQVYTGGDQDFGSAAVVAAAPWDGGNAWHVAGTEGTPTAGIDGSAYYLTASTPSGHGLYMLGEREDDDEPWGPWSDLGWCVEGTFTIDALGDTGTTGPRSIEVRATGEGEQAVGTVHLGDSATAAGVSVGGPTGTDYAPVALTAGERWRFAFDTRSGKVRGKVWKAERTEPANWHVEVPMEETEDDADRWSLWLRGGQAGDQTIRILQVKSRNGARDGQRVAKELVGRADGSTARFTTRHPYRPGTLRVYVNGGGVGPSAEDGDGAEFVLDRRPTAGSIIRASYTVDQGEGDDDE